MTANCEHRESKIYSTDKDSAQ